jgi:processive 1,2-diacylglycerol beta-glucosyltransferase
MVQTIPQMYRYIYDRAERATEVGPFRTWAHQFTAGNLRPLLLRERPDVVVCTHAFPCGAMAEYKRAYADSPPVVGIVTDFAVHGFWLHDNVDRYVVATDAMRAAMLSRGIAPERVVVSGIPVRREFAPSGEPRAALRERLDLPSDRYVALLMGGGLGIAPLERMLTALKAVRLPLAAVVLAGRNARIERRLTAAAERLAYPIRAVPFVENVYDYMHAADVLVTKPGGLSTAEALVARIPMVLSKPLPGQEERNARVLVEAGAAVRTRRLADLPGAVERLLTGAPERDAMAAAARRLARPNASADAAATITSLMQHAKEVPA